jgi:5-methylcytosine-specific restriction endonuclease McrA
MKRCAQCVTEFATRKANALYCSDFCRTRAREARRPARPGRGYRTLRCEWCDRPFRSCNPARTCSRACYGKLLTLANNGAACPLPVKDCIGCGGAFIARAPRISYCSSECRHQHLGTTPSDGPRVRTCGCGAESPPLYRQGGWTCDACKAETRRRGKRMRRARKAGATAERISPTDIYERDGWTCQLCGRPVARAKAVPHPQAPTLDHIVPLSKGGDHTTSNVQCAHFRCNSLKGDRTAPTGDQLRLLG